MFSVLALFLPALFLGGIVSAIGGGGLGIISTILGSFFFDIKTSIAFTSILATTIQIAKILHFRSHIRWDIVGWYVLLGIPMSFLGGLLLFRLSDLLAKILLGGFCLAFVVLRISKKIPRVRPGRWTLIAFGAVNGFIGGVIGSSALIRMPALIAMGMTKEIFVGTSAVIAFLMNLGKSSAYLLSMTWTETLVWLYVLSLPVMMLSVRIGKRLLKYVSIQLFEDIQLAIITLGAIRLLFFP